MNQNVENLQFKNKIFYRCKYFQNMNKKYKLFSTAFQSIKSYGMIYNIENYE